MICHFASKFLHISSLLISLEVWDALQNSTLKACLITWSSFSSVVICWFLVAYQRMWSVMSFFHLHVVCGIKISVKLPLQMGTLWWLPLLPSYSWSGSYCAHWWEWNVQCIMLYGNSIYHGSWVDSHSIKKKTALATWCTVQHPRASAISWYLTWSSVHNIYP